MSANASSFLGVAPEHLPALVAALVLVLVLPLVLRGVRRACGQGFMPAVRFIRGYHAATAATRLAALLLTVSGAVHLVVAIGHDGALAGWLLLDGAALLALGVAAFLVRWWRPAAALTLSATILAYLIATGRGAESVDQLGIATKGIELAALGLVLLPRGLPVRHRRLAWGVMLGAVFPLGVLTGGVPWVVSLKAHEPAPESAHIHIDGSRHAHGHGHGGEVRPPTPAEAAAAARLVEETRAGTLRYADLNVALADGYRPALGQTGDAVHYENRRYVKDSAVLDPERPENLVYVNTPAGPLLAGVVYVMPRPELRAPRPGGSITSFHTHTLCIAPSPPWIAGLLSPFGACPAGSVNIVTPEMMHVWLLDGIPGGPFAEQLDKEYLASLTRR